jgi:hypothetical protein
LYWRRNTSWRKPVMQGGAEGVAAPAS